MSSHAIGSSLDDFLKTEGTFDAMQTQAVKETVAWQQGPATEDQAIQLSPAEQIAFVSAVLDPPAPSERLRQASANYRQACAARADMDTGCGMDR